MRNKHRSTMMALAGGAVLLAATSAMAQPSAADKAAVGYTDLQARLGASTPTGAGVEVAQIEANPSSTTNYRPDITHPELSGRTYIDQTGGSTTPSSHATSVARSFYGDNSLAPGINTINLYDANNWLASGFLNATVNAQPTASVGTRVENHSWIGNVTDNDVAIDILRRLDHVIERDNVVSVVGVNNGSSTSIPDMLANSYNSIAVGLTNGNSSLGPTTLDLVGRRKPDLVAPNSFVSFAAPLVSGSAALLLETATGLGVDAGDASQAQTVKAVLMAGATKSEFSGWSRTTSQPLDQRFGAGELHIDNSHRILTAGQQEASLTQPVSTTGWDFDTITGGSSLTWFFDVGLHETIESLSIIATWHRIMTDAGAGEIGDGDSASERTWNTSLANLDLRLYQASGFVLGSEIDASLSTVDNVEHIYQTNLGPGQYAMVLSSNATSEFAMAWQAVIIPEPASGVLMVLLSVGLTRRRR